ncbi:SCO2522 family protein [Micromonospora sp. NBC_00617]|uniref:SCO2522 family protein n=1 Tax=Micromonospora sp. NBC_00617 TaxID=2903587 RepID=UPI0030DDE4B8
MMGVEVTFAEATAGRRTESVPLSHLSVEVGHLYAEGFVPGDGEMLRHLARSEPWLRAAGESCRRRLPPRVRPRVSTCILVDDYANEIPPPDEVIKQLHVACEQTGVVIDYLARESACAEADGVRLARLVADRLVPDPASRVTGAGSFTTESGWLCNGRRSPDEIRPAMRPPVPWAPPVESTAPWHSIFVDVELWSQDAGVPTWSCALLASVWQLVRLGLLRRHGAVVARPQRFDPAATLPPDWTTMPPVLQLNPDAEPFTAYQTCSVLRSPLLPVEHAVRTILSQIAVDADLLDELRHRSVAEGIELPQRIVDRIAYIFVND